MTNLDKTLFDLSAKEHKSLMEKLQNDELSEWKNTI